MNIFKFIKSRILYKLIIRFVFVSLFVGVVSYLGLNTINEIEKSYGLISTKSLPLIQHLKDMKFACLRLVSSATEYAYLRTESKDLIETEPLEQESKLIQQSCQSCHDAFKKYEELVNKSFPELLKQTNSIRKSGDRLHIVSTEFIEMKKKGLEGSETVEKKEEMEHYEMQFLNEINNTIGYSNSRLKSENLNMDSAISSSFKKIIFLSLMTFFFSVIIGVLYSRELSKPITKLTKQMNEFKKGNLDSTLEIKSSDEIGLLGTSFQDMASKIKLLITQLEGEIKSGKQIQEALTESERQLRNFMEKVPIGIYRTTPDGRILFANPCMVKILGYETLDELQKVNLEEQVFENQQKRKIFKENIERYGEITKYEDTYIKFNGSKIYINEYATCIRDETGNVKYYEGIVEEVTERKKAEESLINSQKLFKDLNDSKDRFFSIIAHDLKNPLSTFIMSTKMLSSNWKMFDEDEKILLLKQMYVNSKNLLQFLENLLTWARSQSRSLEFKRTNFDISEPVKNSVQLLNPGAEQKGIIITSEIKEKTIIYADYDMITTVIRNLISNAIKFTKKDGTITIISEEFTDNENYIVISVKDTGIGMNKESIDSLFRLDVRQSTPGTLDEKGTGLGLLICKEFVEKNKGKIWVESEIDKGSTFSFTVLKQMQTN
ncbi:MAG: PAS domain S-box protein [Ignavibacteriae bacterium]|nr:PAS domain S-box protein [Ignavibacteriota bacterium]